MAIPHKNWMLDDLEDGDSSDDPGGETVLDDILIKGGFGHVARFAKAAPEAIFRSEHKSVEDQELEAQVDEELEALRQKRLDQLKRQATASELPVVQPEEFARVAAESELLVLLLQWCSGSDPDSDHLEKCLGRVAARHPYAKFAKLDASSGCVRNFERKDAPTVMSYRQGRVVAQHRHLLPFGGTKDRVSPESVEWVLARAGVLLTAELEEDPRQPMKINRVAKKIVVASDSDDDDF